MKCILSIVLLTIAILETPVLAGDVTLKTTQNEYTFFAGEEARVPFVVESSFPATNVGSLAYTLTRKENRGGFSFSQSSTQSQSFPISPGSSQNAITLTSEDPADYEVSLSILYRDDGKDFSADLPPFQVHFVPNQTSQQGQGTGQGAGQNSGQGGSPLTSISSAIQSNPSGQIQSRDPFEEMDQQMNAMRQENQQLLQQVMSSQSMISGQGMPSGSQNAQQALQNNQMNAQSSALQQQMTEEAEKNRKDQQELSQRLAQDPLMKKVEQDLNQAGYQQKEDLVSAQGEGSGTIRASFKDQTGKSVEVQGLLQNGSVQELTVRSDEPIPVPRELADDSRYINAKNALQKEGYNETGETRIFTPDETRIEQQFRDSEGKNVTISAVLRNGTVDDVTVQKDTEVPLGWYIGIILLIFLICLCVWAGYRYYNRPKTYLEEGYIEDAIKPVDFLNDTLQMIDDAESDFTAGRIKDAYSRAGQALRFFISHSLGSGVADTSDEIVLVARKSGFHVREIEDILNRCTLVEFAKDEGSSEEFGEIISGIRLLIQDYRHQVPAGYTEG
jgi:hypothetical protein